MAIEPTDGAGLRNVVRLAAILNNATFTEVGGFCVNHVRGCE